MKTINVEWLKRIDNVHDKLKRSVPIGSKTSRCTKEILIDRYFKFLNGRAFKLKIPITSTKYLSNENDVEYETFYAWFNKVTHTVVSSKDHNGEVHYDYGVQKYNGWNDHEFTISFRDEKLKRREFQLHWNDILRIEYEEIPVKKYFEISELFIDMDTNEMDAIDECVHIDEAQGKYYCTSEDLSNKRCIGTVCGEYDKKK